MKKSLRLSETWFNRGLWLVALVFAGFLIGLGGQIVEDLPGVDRQLELNDYIDKAKAAPLRTQLQNAEQAAQEARLAQDQARLLRDAAQSDSRNASESFNNWIATRQATQQSDQNAELLKRTQQLDAVKQRELSAIRALEAQDKALLDAEQAADKARIGLATLESAAQKHYDADALRLELQVFLIRLAITLPLLVLAGWLFRHKRKTAYWPFVWGFIIFAGFAFFVELVPYLPSYGGYVRYLVGIVLTVLIGRQAIVSLSRYLEKQHAAVDSAYPQDSSSVPKCEQEDAHHGEGQSDLQRHTDSHADPGGESDLSGFTHAPALGGFDRHHAHERPENQSGQIEKDHADKAAEGGSDNGQLAGSRTLRTEGAGQKINGNRSQSQQTEQNQHQHRDFLEPAGPGGQHHAGISQGDAGQNRQENPQQADDDQGG